ncbi:MAG TPA: hypothetical protein VLF69_02955 [Candidatus Saccharimonadales bacterium]|nr:hypothetical protein [Candidatus Saccharimonadales bacterium]
MKQSLISTKTKAIGGIWLVTLGWWVVLALTHTKYKEWNYWYQVLLAIIPLVGGLFGFMNSHKWGGLHSRLGQATFFIAAGLTTWGLGQCYWSYATIRKLAEVPYPSWADVGYIVSWPLWTAGIILLALAAGARFSIRKHAPLKFYSIVLTMAAAIIAGSYYLLIVVARHGLALDGEGPMRQFFDLAYPIGDVVILTIAALTATVLFRYLGGRYRLVIATIIAGYAFNYLTDFTFSYVTTAQTYYNGHFVDLMFPTVMAVLSIGLASLEPPKITESTGA